MNPRLLSALFLSMGIFLLWPRIEKQFFPKVYSQRQVQSKMAVQKKTKNTSLSKGEVVSSDRLIVSNQSFLKDSSVENIILKNEHIKVDISPFGGGIVSVTSLDFKEGPHKDEYILPKKDFSGGYLKTDMFDFSTDVIFEVKEKSSQHLVLSFQTAEGVLCEKTYRLQNGYGISFSVKLKYVGETAFVLKDGYVLHLADHVGVLNYDQKDKRFLRLAVFDQKDSKPTFYKKVDEDQTLYKTPLWVSVQSKYFTFIVKPQQSLAAIHLKKGKYPPRAMFQTSSLILKKGQEIQDDYEVYVGPKNREVLKSLGSGFEKSVSYGYFNSISLFLLFILNFLYGFIGNYGISIVLLTMLVKLALLPISQKGFKSMKKLQNLQPHIVALRAKYKDNPQKAQIEMMKLYKQNKVNPMGGCLPLIAQMPIFLALFWLLQSAVELRGEPFLFWIKDLSAKDSTYLLPIAMGASMFVQQLVSPSVGDPSQKKIMMFLPLIMTFLFVNFPSGLVLYWLTNNILSIIHQKLIQKR
ncbi:hypothetical protein AB834_06990 [PVC group bacterium (ex Bugula neritina AB1)]|nr:hypothetical protein AB834_06990 [PVC group bacterium (ex Bugula neritina AB1)]